MFIDTEKRTLEEDCWAAYERVNVLHGTEAKTFGFLSFLLDPNLQVNTELGGTLAPVSSKQ